MKERTKNWLEYVERDIAVAESIVGNEFVANIVLFHCQQAVEKVIKATLEELALDVPKIHYILKLYSLIPEEIKPRLQLNILDLEMVDEIYINTRYPSSHGLLPSGFPSRKQAEEILLITKNIVETVLAYLNK